MIKPMPQYAIAGDRSRRANGETMISLMPVATSSRLIATMIEMMRIVPDSSLIA